jgi:ribosomal protein L31E
MHTKILEKLIINRIVYDLRKRKLLKERQYGFTAQTSAEDALYSLVNFIQKRFESKCFVLVFAIEIDGAFNNCWWPKIVNKLKSKICQKKVVKHYQKLFLQSLYKTLVSK